ncbi:MAG: PIN domain-containing protein [Acidobacteria bacterium]|nr:PIN domain-containing protein [Acidobacteriota bacterium]MYG76008.1 PIN domain-containing protein [Acidobacteriota bacterium]
MHFVDTNVLLYAVSPVPEEAAKRQRATDLLATTADLCLSVQVLQEFYSQVTGSKGLWGMSHEEAERSVRSLERFRVQPVTLQVLHAAMTLRERFQINYWDAAILAAARVAGCDTVYTEDLNDGQDYDGVRVVDPFA